MSVHLCVCVHVVCCTCSVFLCVHVVMSSGAAPTLTHWSSGLWHHSPSWWIIVITAGTEQGNRDVNKTSSVCLLPRHLQGNTHTLLLMMMMRMMMSSAESPPDVDNFLSYSIFVLDSSILPAEHPSSVGCYVIALRLHLEPPGSNMAAAPTLTSVCLCVCERERGKQGEGEETLTTVDLFCW